MTSFKQLTPDQVCEAEQILDCIANEVKPFEDYTELAYKYVLLKEHSNALHAILTWVRSELDDHSDVIDNPEGGRPRPNLAMRLLQYVDEKLAELKR